MQIKQREIGLIFQIVGTSFKSKKYMHSSTRKITDYMYSVLNKISENCKYYMQILFYPNRKFKEKFCDDWEKGNDNIKSVSPNQRRIKLLKHLSYALWIYSVLH